MRPVLGPIAPRWWPISDDLRNGSSRTIQRPVAPYSSVMGQSGVNPISRRFVENLAICRMPLALGFRQMFCGQLLKRLEHARWVEPLTPQLTKFHLRHARPQLRPYEYVF